MYPSLFITAVLPLALIVFVLVSVVYYLSRKTEETNFEKEMKELRKSLIQGKLDRTSFLYIIDNLKAENHFSEESQKMDEMFEDKKLDSETYLRMKKVLEMSFNKRLVKIHDQHYESVKRSKKDFETYLKVILENEYPKVKYNNPDAWQMKTRAKIVNKNNTKSNRS